MNSILIIISIMATIAVFLNFFLKKANDKSKISDDQELANGVLFVIFGHFLSYLVMIFMRWKHFNLISSLKALLIIIYFSQLLYVIPGAIVAESKNRRGIIKGIMIAAGLTFLLSVISCSVMCSTNKWS